MKKNYLKIILDSIMLLVLTLMYQKQVISMTFHEVGGLALLGLFLVHMAINHRWITTVTKKLFSKSLPLRTRIGYLVNLLLLISFALIGISGILISKELFSLHGGNEWKTVHYTSAAAALVLMGIHLALHWRFIVGVAKKAVRIPAKITKPLSLLLAVAIFAFGVYSMTSTSFLRWLTMPFSAQGGEMARPEGIGFEELSGTTQEAADTLAKTSGDATDSTTADTSNTSLIDAQQTQADASTADSTQVTQNTSSSSEQTATSGFPSKGRVGEGMVGKGGGREGGGAFSFGNLLLVITQYASISGSIAVALLMIGKLFGLLKRKNKPVMS